MPSWVKEPVSEFTKRLQEYTSLHLIEIPIAKRGKRSDLARILEKEALLISNAIPPAARLIALDLKGEAFSSEQLAAKLQQLQQITSHLCFVIGGPEGLHAQILGRSQERWCLSSLTLPHPLVRIVLLEGIYRAYSIIHNHPYHK